MVITENCCGNVDHRQDGSVSHKSMIYPTIGQYCPVNQVLKEGQKEQKCPVWAHIGYPII